MQHTIITYSNFYNPRQKLKIFAFSEFKELANHIMYVPHRLDYYGIITVTSGDGKHKIGDKILDIQQGAIILLHPGQLHCFLECTDIEGYILAFSDDFFMTTLKNEFLNENYDILTNFAEQSVIHVRDNNWKILLHILETIVMESANDYDKIQTVVLQHLLSSYLQILNRDKISKKNSIIQKTEWEKRIALNFKMLLKEGVSHNYSLKKYLEILGISQSSLQIATKKTFSKTPKCILDEALILEAKKQLLDHQKRIQDISYDLGFSEPTNFSKFFKKKTGITPEAYRKGDFI